MFLSLILVSSLTVLSASIFQCSSESRSTDEFLLYKHLQQLDTLRKDCNQFLTRCFPNSALKERNADKGHTKKSTRAKLFYSRLDDPPAWPYRENVAFVEEKVVEGTKSARTDSEVKHGFVTWIQNPLTMSILAGVIVSLLVLMVMGIVVLRKRPTSRTSNLRTTELLNPPQAPPTRIIRRGNGELVSLNEETELRTFDSDKAEASTFLL